MIVWKESALARFVEKNRLGFCVNSLKELPEMINKISESDYEAMLVYVEQISKQIQYGEKLNKIIKQ